MAADTGVAGHLELIPTGVGESKLVRCDRLEGLLWWWFLPDGNRLLVPGSAQDKSTLALVVPIDGGEPTVAGSGTPAFPLAISHDGERFVAPGPGERTAWQEVSPADPAGILDIFPVWLTGDGEHY